MIRLSRVLILLAMPLLLAAGTVVVDPAAEPADARRLLDCGRTESSRWCSYMTRNIENGKQANFRSSVRNTTGQRITGECDASQSTTSDWSVGGSVSGEIKAGIFGGVQTEVNGSISRSKTAAVGVRVSFPVPPRSTRYCDWGIVNERIKGFTRLSYCGGGCQTVRRSWSFKAPARTRWWVY